MLSLKSIKEKHKTTKPMKQEEEPITGLPENAFRELKPGEVYNPLMSPDKKYSEVNAWSVTWGNGFLEVSGVSSGSIISYFHCSSLSRCYRFL